MKNVVEYVTNLGRFQLTTDSSLLELGSGSQIAFQLFSPRGRERDTGPLACLKADKSKNHSASGYRIYCSQNHLSTPNIVFSLLFANSCYFNN
jgi:hypothetical protein